MLAAVFQGPGQMEVTEVETPDIGADEVLVKVGANTICGTDVRIFRGEKTRGIHPPTILGHEIAGHVYQVGKRVRGFEVGAPVAIAPVIACRRCFYCQNGMENVCPNQRILGYVSFIRIKAPFLKKCATLPSAFSEWAFSDNVARRRFLVLSHL